MKNTAHEKLALIFLSLSLLTGSAILYAKHSRPFTEITVIKDGAREELTLAQAEELLEEERRVNINSASAKELTAIPGIGEVMATRIVEYRTAHGNFHTEEDLLNVPGIGEKKLEKFRGWVKVE
jgi:comEA protein